MKRLFELVLNESFSTKGIKKYLNKYRVQFFYITDKDLREKKDLINYVFTKIEIFKKTIKRFLLIICN